MGPKWEGGLPTRSTLIPPLGLSPLYPSSVYTSLTFSVYRRFPEYIGVRGLPTRGIFFLGAMGLGPGHLESCVFRVLNKRHVCS